MNTWMTRARMILEIEVSIPPAELAEAAVRLPPRSSRSIAVYTGPTAAGSPNRPACGSGPGADNGAAVGG